ncbi:MAG: 4'-phosphopantetheinyl transferase superfamily protein [Methanothrix sp.]|nr:4'-phosphopantetheinyl transferase superfamily protein [Methanothrix sp.]
MSASMRASSGRSGRKQAERPLAENWPVLRPNEVHVWRVDLARTYSMPVVRNSLLQTLSIEERKKLEGHVLSAEQDRLFSSRGVLRTILGTYLALSPSRIEFTYGHRGKPALASTQSDRNIQFNISHSGDWMLCAISSGCELGVDIEMVRRNVDVEGMARLVFSDLDLRRFACTPARSRAELFFTSWVRREAFVKAIGEGLHFPLAAVSGTLCAGAVQRMKAIGPAGSDAKLFLQDLDIAPEYKAALVVTSPVPPPLQFEWRPGDTSSLLPSLAQFAVAGPGRQKDAPSMPRPDQCAGTSNSRSRGWKIYSSI